MDKHLETIREIIKSRDGASDSDVDDMLAAAGEEIADGGDPEEVLSSVFGLEPDYLMDKEFWNVVETNY